jgi:ankyrin repeat protein
MVDFLLNHGADPTIPSDGDYPLGLVFDSDTSVETQLKILHLLVIHGADINNVGKNEYPLAVDAIEVDSLAVLNAVLALKPNLEALTPGGQTATYMAATYGKADFLDALVVAGANYTPTLATVASLGDLDKVNQMLADGTDPNTPDQRKVQPIIFAAIGGHNNVVEALLAAGADKNTAAITRALHHAVEKNHREVVNTLIIAGADVNASGSSTTPIVLAATNGNLSIVKLLDEAGAKRDGALSAAARNDHADVASYLLDQGADPYETLPGNKSIPLIFAAFSGHAGVVDLLLKKTTHGYSQEDLDQALAYAVGTYISYYHRSNNGLAFNGYFVPADPPSPNALHDTPDAYLQTFALLANQGAQPIALQPSSRSLLTQAVACGDVPLVTLLLNQAHADPNAVNGNNVTVLHDVAQLSNPTLHDNRLRILTLLLDHGADIARERPSRITLSPKPDDFAKSFHQGNLSVLDDFLLAAPTADSRDAVKLLLARGASFRATGGNESEDLIRAVALGDQAKAAQALAAGASVNQKFRNDWTPFLVACALGDLDMVKLLLANHADLRSALAWGYVNARTLSIYSENPDVIRFIYSSLNAEHINTPVIVPMLDQVHSSAAAQALLAEPPSPARQAQLALRDAASRSVLPDTFGVILSALPPVSQASDTPNPATPASSANPSPPPSTSPATTTSPAPTDSPSITPAPSPAPASP